MDEQTRRALAGSLGNPERDFELQPLTQEEIQAVVRTYSKEILRSDLDPELREVYRACVDFLKEHLVFH